MVWTYAPDSAPWGILVRVASFFLVPTGILLLGLWFNDNPLHGLPVFGRLARRLETSPRMTLALVPLMVVTIFVTLLMLSTLLPILRPELDTQSSIFLTGLLTLMAGLFVTFNWLGEKEDYSRTAYALKSSPDAKSGGGARPFPRASPGPQPSEQQRQDRKYG